MEGIKGWQGITLQANKKALDFYTAVLHIVTKFTLTDSAKRIHGKLKILQ